MYGLVQSFIISHTYLKEHLLPFGYAPAPITPCLWRHKNRGIKFTSVVDNFGIKYISQDDAENLNNTIKDKFEVTQNSIGVFYNATTLHAY